MIEQTINRPHLEVIQSLESEVQTRLRFLTEVQKIWQPTDLLPDMRRDDWREQVEQMRKDAAGLSDELLVVLVGDMVTEEALPSYSTALNVLVQDHQGDATTAWAQWLRGWTAEENRHGDLLNAYLRFTGRVDMRSVEITVQNLLRTGFNPRSYPDPYGGLVYTSFQERATRISHQNVAQLAAAQGDPRLSIICNRIAGDEARHEMVYTDLMGLVFEKDPEGGMLAFYDMMKTMVAMPGRHMNDGVTPKLFDQFAAVAQRLGVYTILDYTQIMKHLIERWDIAHRSVSGAAAKAQHFLCRQPERYMLLAERVNEMVAQQQPAPFAWIDGRKA